MATRWFGLAVFFSWGWFRFRTRNEKLAATKTTKFSLGQRKAVHAMPPENLKYMALLREPRKKPSYFPLYWLIGILIMLYYNLNNQGFCIAQVVISHRCLLLRPKMFPPQKSPSSVTKKLVHSEVKHSLHGKLGTTFPLSCSPVLLGFMTHFQLNPLPTERTPRPKPIGSMYGICTYISLKFMVNLGKYSIRGGKTGIKKNYPIPSMGLIYLLT